jgi:hypothetical protein
MLVELKAETEISADDSQADLFGSGIDGPACTRRNGRCRQRTAANL